MKVRLTDHKPTKRDLDVVQAFALVLQYKLKMEGYKPKPSPIMLLPSGQLVSRSTAPDVQELYKVYALAAYRLNMDEVETDEGGVIDLVNRLCDVYLAAENADPNRLLPTPPISAN